MGLNHPENIELWRAWERSRHPARNAKHAAVGVLGRVRRGGRNAAAVEPAETAGPGWVLRSSDGPRPERVLIAIDSGAPTTRASLLTVLPYLGCGVDLISPAGVEAPEIGSRDWTSREGGLDELLAGIEADLVVSAGPGLAAADAAHEHARARGIVEHVVQHGALTPFAPPLPRDVTLHAWSRADGDFWRSGRADITVVPVGSQLLWQAAHEGGAGTSATDATGATGTADAADAAGYDRPVFLGQLHGAELSRRVTGGAAWGFCRAEKALYRPHPAETDVLSRTIHRAMRRTGIEFAPTDVPLARMTAPVVAVFSTGVLEAAARGVRAWVHGPSAPGWVHEFWHRYDMRPYGGEPTPAPAMPDGEPAAAIARTIESAL
ncbi:hypothetical protein [Brachybacterium huguangmaarense]